MSPEPTNEPERREPEEDSGGDNQMRVAGMIVGTALIFIGFLDIFLDQRWIRNRRHPLLDLFRRGRRVGECGCRKLDHSLQPHRRSPRPRSRFLPIWGSPLLAQASVVLVHRGGRHVFHVQRTEETRLTRARSVWLIWFVLFIWFI